jgi:hypothetical protein
MGWTRRQFVAGALGAGVAGSIEGQTSNGQKEPDPHSRGKADWLVDPSPFAAEVTSNPDRREITLSNGLIRRIFRLRPNAATIAFDNLMTGESELRSIRPEAILTINNYELAVGGLLGQPIQHYLLPEWLDHMTADPRAFRFDRVEEGKPVERFAWKRMPAWSAAALPWPPPGRSLIFYYEPGPETPIQGVSVQVHYELYDGIPLMAKWLAVINHSGARLQLNSFKAEVLAVLAREMDAPTNPPLPLVDNLLPLHVETDYAFGGASAASANPAVHWLPDPQYGGADYEHQQPSLLECKPPLGPELEIASNEVWNSFSVFELLHDSSEMERRGLAMRRMVRALAPWVAENPIFMHARYAAPEKVKMIIDQCAAVGFEMVILSFGSGFDIEDDNPQSMQQMTQLAEYGHQKGIALGGYSLLASRGGKPQDLVIDVNTGKPGGGKFGPSPCLCSRWGENYFRKLHQFFPQTKMLVFENDGSYPGDYCASTEHPGHRGYLDSQWKQWKVMSDFYRWCRGLGIYLTVPDWYFLNGQSKTGMGYTENDWSLPREFQPLIERQNIYDGTWTKTASMGWMHVPLMQYHGGGSSATVEPLHENLTHYETRLADLLGAGVQAAWRGDRLYDTDETKQAVIRWVEFYKKNRAILDSDIIHLRRPDGRDWDGILHVNSRLDTRGLAMLYNPLQQSIIRQINLPLYYTGLTKTAQISHGESSARSYVLDRDYNVTVEVSIPAESRLVLTVR